MLRSARAWDRLREDVSFKAMKEKIIQHRSSVSWRQTLSAHMTQSCAVLSLKSCGFDCVSTVQTDTGTLYQLHMEFPHSFHENDNMPFSYASDLHASKKEAQDAAACDIMVAMLLAAPRSFRMVSSCFQRGALDIEELHSFAETLDINDQQVWQDACSAKWTKRASQHVSAAPDRANGSVGRVHEGPVSDSPEFDNDGEVLNADETVWRRRCETRHQGVVHMKTNDLYFQAMWAAHEKNIARPRTPDPFDRSTSKREWEKDMMRWRKELHRIAQTAISSTGVEL
jgi:hypothetical protein